ncbi:TonB-dependent receptor family protein [Pararoseomonas indoligenes]|uniref:TonB-dependent receptor n=1 Tax=Roseomonas indoligenes TaxID=2820811 RepID=A0A940MV76_9PROT|nr:TonB-dependent receptor [Pararoseomonas indoligenes]MBP0494059.1 TonB-dependent receptor [Pararoseomonas indoligenes]
MFRPHAGPLGAALLAAALPLSPALAQQSPVPIPEVTVSGAAGALTTRDTLEAEAALRQLPGNVSVVPAEEIRLRAGVTTLRDVLEFEPGVFAQPKWGEDTRLSIRGSGLARNNHLRGVQLTQDGIPLNQADGAGDFQELDPLTLDHMEVYRGGNAFGLGAATLGGVLNAVTPTGRSAPGALLRGEAGSYGFLRGQAAYGVAAGAFDAWASFSALSQEGFRDHSNGNSRRFNGNIGWRIKEDVETRFYYGYNNIEQRIPGTLTRALALSDPRRAAAANLSLDYQRNIESNRVGNRTTWRIAPGVALETGVSFVHRELDHPIFQYLDQRTDDVNGFARLTLEGTAAGMRNVGVIGGTFGLGTYDSRRYVNNAGHAGRLTYASTDRARTNTVILQDTLYVLPTLGVVAGIQLGEAYRASRDKFLSDGDSSGSTTYRYANPRLGAVWEVTPEWQAFANLTWATEPPTISDLTPLASTGFASLRAQRARTLEIGTRGRSGDLGWELAAYRSWIRDEIQLFDPNGTGASFALNADRTIHQGIEAAGSWVARRNTLAEGDSLTLRGAYTLNDFRFDGDARYGSNELPGVPRHLLRAELRYRHPAGASIAPNLEWVPRGLFADNANTLQGNSYALLGLRGDWAFRNGLSVFVEGRNLTDKRYISSAAIAPVASPASAVFEPGFGRSVYGGMQFRF